MLGRQRYKPWDIQPEERRGQQHDTFGLGRVCRRKRTVEIVGTADLDNMQVDAQGGCGLLQGCALVGGARGIPEDGDPCEAGDGVLEQLELLAA